MIHLKLNNVIELNNEVQIKVESLPTMFYLRRIRLIQYHFKAIYLHSNVSDYKSSKSC